MGLFDRLDISRPLRIPQGADPRAVIDGLPDIRCKNNDKAYSLLCDGKVEKAAALGYPPALAELGAAYAEKGQPELALTCYLYAIRAADQGLPALKPRDELRPLYFEARAAAAYQVGVAFLSGGVAGRHVEGAVHYLKAGFSHAPLGAYQALLAYNVPDRNALAEFLEQLLQSVENVWPYKTKVENAVCLEALRQLFQRFPDANDVAARLYDTNAQTRKDPEIAALLVSHQKTELSSEDVLDQSLQHLGQGARLADMPDALCALLVDLLVNGRGAALAQAGLAEKTSRVCRILLEHQNECPLLAAAGILWLAEYGGGEADLLAVARLLDQANGGAESGAPKAEALLAEKIREAEAVFLSGKEAWGRGDRAAAVPALRRAIFDLGHPANAELLAIACLALLDSDPLETAARRVQTVLFLRAGKPRDQNRFVALPDTPRGNQLCRLAKARADIRTGDGYQGMAAIRALAEEGLAEAADFLRTEESATVSAELRRKAELRGSNAAYNYQERGHAWKPGRDGFMRGLCIHEIIAYWKFGVPFDSDGRFCATIALLYGLLADFCIDDSETARETYGKARWFAVREEEKLADGCIPGCPASDWTDREATQKAEGFFREKAERMGWSWAVGTLPPIEWTFGDR